MYIFYRTASLRYFYSSLRFRFKTVWCFCCYLNLKYQVLFLYFLSLILNSLMTAERGPCRACRKDLPDAAGSLSKGIVFGEQWSPRLRICLCLLNLAHAFYSVSPWSSRRPLLSSGGIIPYLPSGFLTSNSKETPTGKIKSDFNWINLNYILEITVLLLLLQTKYDTDCANTNH